MSTLSVRDVTHSYPTSPRPVLTDVNLEIPEGEMVAIVGESGCGKTTLGRLIAGLHQPTEGTIEFNGTDINSLRGGERKQWRRRVQMVHQDPYGSLNPGLTLAGTLAPGLLVHKVATHRTVEKTMIDLLQQVGLDATPTFLNRYPHQLSGGQRQRVSIARAIGLEPDLIVADEVTSMLDVSMRVAILDLLIKFRRERGLGYAFISHDFGVVRYFARGGRIAVMFFGRIVEEGPVDEVIISPAHPYTRMLLESIPIPDPVLARERHLDQAERLIGTPAQKGCVFANRCPMVSLSAGRRCHLWHRPRVRPATALGAAPACSPSAWNRSPTCRSNESSRSAMSQLSVAARGMIGLGLGMLILALVVRPSIRNPASRWADTGSIIISLLMVAAGVVVARREATKEAGHDDEWDLTDDPRP